MLTRWHTIANYLIPFSCRTKPKLVLAFVIHLFDILGRSNVVVKAAGAARRRISNTKRNYNVLRTCTPTR
jgi:hypothetical protein